MAGERLPKRRADFLCIFCYILRAMTANPFDNTFEKVKKLVEVFRQNQKHYLSPSYSEADARKDFIDKFWIALGWDVNHETQTNPYEQEVKVERSGTGSERRRRADYAFLAQNFRDVRFYVEAKKPSVELENRDYYFQTIRYGWNSRSPIAVLTDFEQFHILDCRYKPDLNTVLYRALKKYHFAEYADREKFAEIYYLFSREAVLNGSIDKYAEDLPKPSGKARQRSLFPTGGYQAVDESFLQKLDEYRDADSTRMLSQLAHLSPSSKLHFAFEFKTTNTDNFKDLPRIRSFIDGFKTEITCKEVKQKKHSVYALHRARNERIFLKQKKIIGVITEDEIVVAQDSQQTYATDGLYLFSVKNENHPNYLMGILNSKLFVLVYRLLSSEEGRGFSTSQTNPSESTPDSHDQFFRQSRKSVA